MVTALFVGRFQPPHKAHITVIKHILSTVDTLVLVIGSSQEELQFHNCFTATERKSMIYDALDENERKRVTCIEIIDVYDNEKWYALLAKQLPKIDRVYSGNKNTQRVFESHGHTIHKLELIDDVSSTAIREKIVHDDASWKQLVPATSVALISQPHIQERIKHLYAHKQKTGEGKCIPE